MDWRESPTEAWSRETRRAAWRRAKASLAAASAYAATLGAMFGSWQLYEQLEDALWVPIHVFATVLGLVVVFGPPALAARAAYMRVMNTTPTASRTHPPHRPTTF